MSHPVPPVPPGIQPMMLVHVRTFQLRDDPNLVVLEVAAVEGSHHYLLEVDDLLEFGKRMIADATLLKGCGGTA